uniref:Uncharacterized protein n=1 Tax=Candidatus Kentrum sp. LPFa TaxID=2126335 RepID=A0A450WXY7_9GAMM|nr:MAG: hypothetical protein BECKLPF1236B_GA0070989_12822 [Candidatus Kentron sp. LPFa]
MARIAMNVALFLPGWKDNLRLPKTAPNEMVRSAPKTASNGP